MPKPSWTDIQNNALQFASRWQGETYEKGESQTFWSEFLSIFGIDRRRHGAFFEYAIKKGNGKQGFIDLFWPGRLLAEQKSAGKDTAKARLQAYDYLATMPDHDLPQMIVVSDFATFELVDNRVVPNTSFTFPLADLPNHVRRFAFLIDERTEQYAEEDPVNRTAAETMAALHNQLAAARYTGRDLETLLVRLVFCLFADDAHIFERNQFANYLRNRTRDDGADLGPQLVQIFEILNTPEDQRQTTLDPELLAFPYINGGLFDGPIRTPGFSTDMRRNLLTAALVDWGKVSPAIFGSMFQGVMDPETRRNLGAHYTSERNILRVIKPLFLDDLYAEFARVADKPAQLRRFHGKLATINVLDPACGSGNFLVITYRELRQLEHKVVRTLHKGQVSLLDVQELLKVNVDQMHGIELEEFPALIAQTALWLTDHQMNLEASRLLGQHYVRLPLTASANIAHANALTTDWASVVPPEKLTYILGNPPFVGSKMMTSTMREELLALFPGVRGAGTLDFVTAWYAKALGMMEANPSIESALVSTNSITQGEQVGVLWKHLLAHGVHINFAHQTFKWTNDARGVAAVYCVIVGFALKSRPDKHIFEYPNIRGEATDLPVKRINPYLVDAPLVFVESRQRPLSQVPDIGIGSQPLDDGNYLFTREEKDDFLIREPGAQKFFRPWIGSQEFIKGIERWGMWLANARPDELRNMPEVLKRVEAVRSWRAKSKRKATVAGASIPTRFLVENMPEGESILIPKVSSERREYIPMGIVRPDVLVSDLVFLIPNASQYHFGILTSRMHMAWVRAVCGRLESRYRYSKDIVYNNFPWPENVTEAQTADIERLAQAVLDARALFPESTLADLYDPLTMPPALAKAHATLDRAVDRLYRKAPFESDTDRVALLFERYQTLTTA